MKIEKQILVDKKQTNNYNNFTQSKILAKSCFNDSHRVSTIPEGTIISTPTTPGVNLRELLARIQEKRK